MEEVVNLVPRALFPGFGGGAPRPQSQGKAPWGRGWEVVPYAALFSVFALRENRNKNACV